MIITDHRSISQRKTHRWIVTGRDTFLSGWGMASNGVSRASWACRTLNEAYNVEQHIRARTDMRYVSIHKLPHYRPRHTAQWSIYPITRNHRYAAPFGK